MYRKELLYTIILFICLELLTLVVSINQYLLVSLLGLIVVLVWAVNIFIKYSFKQVSKYSDEMMKLQFKVRWYQYFVVPILFFVSLAAYIFYVKEDFMRQVIILIGSFANYIMFVHTKISYEKMFLLSRVSKVAFDLINIIFFFIVANVLVISGVLPFWAIVFVLALICLIILVSNLLLTREFSLNGFFVAICMSVFLLTAGIYFQPYLYDRFSFLMTVVFYVMISFWHIRMMGERRFDKYISPVLFAIMAIILIVGK